MIRPATAQAVAFAAELDAYNARVEADFRAYAHCVGEIGHGRRAVPMFSHDADFWNAVSDVQTAMTHRRMFEERAARYPVKEDKPFRVWISSPCFSGSWDFATVDEARGYILHQIERKNGRVYIGGAPAGPDSVDPMETFIQGPEGVVSTVYEMGWSRRDENRVWIYLEPAPACTDAPQRDESQEHAADAALYVTSVVGVLDDKTASVTTTYDFNALASKSQAERLARVYGHLVAPPNGRTYGVFAARNGADEITRLEAGGVDVVELLKVADAPAEPPSLEDQFRALLKAGLSKSAVREIMAEDQQDAFAGHIEKARELYADDDQEIDATPEVSQADDGAWIAGWFWVSNRDVDGFEGDEEEDESDDD